MNDYENIVISAVRYALGRMTYIVRLTVDYVIKEIDNKKLSEYCLRIIKRDIEEARDLGMECDEVQWKKLKNKIEEVVR